LVREVESDDAIFVWNCIAHRNWRLSGEDNDKANKENNLYLLQKRIGIFGWKARITGGQCSL
jgi:hypothetical protein